MPFDVIIIGGGLHGASAALHLALRRQRVLVLEKSMVGRHASGANAGGVRTLGRDLAEVPLAVAGMELWHGIASLVGDDCGFHAHGQLKVAESAAEMQALEARQASLQALGFQHFSRLRRGVDRPERWCSQPLPYDARLPREGTGAWCRVS
jgi:sarcosine oxidase subunit beta